MEYEKKHKKLLKAHYITLTALGIPSEILDNLKNWIFFLQEGWNGTMHWHYKEELSQPQIIKLYWFIKNNDIESELAKDIETTLNLKDKTQFQIKEIRGNTFDFYINQKQLSRMINIDRFDMMYSDFDLDIIEKNEARNKINNNAIDTYLGNKKPMNQFGTDRQVLYRCHCGSDYCGCITTELIVTEHTITWKNIGFEDDDGFTLENNERDIKSIRELKFNRIEYEHEFENYLQRIKDASIEINKNGK